MTTGTGIILFLSISIIAFLVLFLTFNAFFKKEPTYQQRKTMERYDGQLPRVGKINRVVLALIIMLAVAYSGKCQETKPDSLTGNMIKLSTWWSIGYTDSTVTVSKGNDGVFEIKGDSIAAIKLLWKRLEECQKRESDLWTLVGKSVDFTNTIPDYLMKSKAWYRYYAELKKHGYKQIKK
jgi:heme/copper-type cytochrome/quinol oxidase subunit 2